MTETSLPRFRPAETGDLKRLLMYGEYFWRQTPYHSTGMEYNPSCVKGLLKRMMKEHYLRVYEDNQGQMRGFIGIMIYPFHFNDEHLFATELFFFVHPEYRESGIGTLMLRKTEEDLKEMGVDILSLGEMRSSQDMTTMYESQGYVLTERAYAKVL